MFAEYLLAQIQADAGSILPRREIFRKNSIPMLALDSSATVRDVAFDVLRSVTSFDLYGSADVDRVDAVAD